MHPAPSVIIFTTLSGLGFGLLTWLGLMESAPTGRAAFWVFGLAFALSVGGLMASTFHLGHPERAWRAFSQWKTSWLSREGVCAVSALLVMGIYAAGLIFLGRHLVLMGMLGAFLSLGTIFTTSMIYAQLATVPRWNTWLTPALLLTLSITGGAILAGERSLAVLLLVIAGALQLAWWRRGDQAFFERGSDLGTATGLGTSGAVRSMAYPHTSPNYLMKEFVYIVGRRHAQKLRAISISLMFFLPLGLLLVFPPSFMTTLITISCHVAGVAVSRWLFFAEAEHVVGLYYGMR